MSSLEPVRQKIIWAEHHQKSLVEEIERYFDGKPCDLMPENDSEGHLRYRVRYDNPIPPSIPLMIGDCVQNLRAALDYLVWELVLVNRARPSSKNQFPICDDKKGFAKQKPRGRLNGVSEGVAEEIEKLQPYNDGAQTNPLRRIDYLSVCNRHRRLLVVVLNPHAARQDPMIRANLSAGGKMQAEGNALFHLAMDEGTEEKIEVRMELRGLLSYVTDFVIPRFEKFF
ncbi:MAG TPA: hypothetical protein VKV15_09700 [Bryobacteraceae bacterium]|nr:hypothetical protein [Bryobacteraceae bacterium]